MRDPWWFRWPGWVAAVALVLAVNIGLFALCVWIAKIIWEAV